VRTKARLKWLLAAWGDARFRAAVEAEFGMPLAPAGEPAPLESPRDHLGVHRQRQEGLRYVGLHVPVGRVTASQLLGLARLSEEYGAGELRLTASQNVIIPGVPERRVAALLGEPLLQTLSPNPSSVWRGLVACTGNDYCHYSLIDTKSRAVELANALEARGFDPPDGFRMHLSGCVHACGKHHIADVGLQGQNVRLEGNVVEAADVFVGGQTGDQARLGERVARQVPAFNLADKVLELFPAHVRVPLAVPEPGDA
jgi:ferredoxin-nitrite reductase